MAVDLTVLNQKLAALEAAVAASETVSASAVTLISGFTQTLKDEIAKAIQADDAIDNSAIDTVNAVIDAVTARTTANSDALGAAVTANTPNA